MTTVYPVKLKHSPIIDAVCDIRFKSTHPGNVVPVLVANKLGITNTLKPLPSLQVPEQVRQSDPNFQFVPVYEVTLDGFSVRLGDSVIAISSSIPYVGWERFQAVVNTVVIAIFKVGQVEKVERAGYRTVNFFPSVDVSNRLKLKIDDPTDMDPLSYEYVRVFQKGELKARVHVMNDANLANRNVIEGSHQGSIIDIDAYCMGVECDSVDLLSVLGQCHDLGKRVFFDLLEPDFILEMEPETNE